MPPLPPGTKLTSLRRVRLPGSSATWNIDIQFPAGATRGTIASITQDASTHDAETQSPPLVLPALTHPHIHLDKAFLHSTPEYAHLHPTTGSFQEALTNTTKAKQSFTRDDLQKRGEWLLAESVSYGVTAMRAFVEVDHTVGMKCLDVAANLKTQWNDSCQMQIVCFAQDPIFSTEHGQENLNLIEAALERYPQIDVIGTTPYVESSDDAAKRNIDWAIDRALQLDKHLDFHLDYHLDMEKLPLVWYVLARLKQRAWTSTSTNKRVMLGHCTLMTLFKDEEWEEVSRIIHENDLPISFVGLPTSDLYMASEPHFATYPYSPRGTLHMPEMINKYNLDAVLGVNNVGNAFTPWGCVDPLFLACLGVGLYQRGTQADAELLYECVSTRARASIGLSPSGQPLAVRVGDCADLLLFHERDLPRCGIPRPRGTVAEVVWSPPERIDRELVNAGYWKANLELRTCDQNHQSA